MKHIISLSGGKDSTAMMLMMIEKKMPIDRIICIDTTKEFPAMYRHIEKLQEYIKPLEIEIYSFDFDYWFGEHIKTKGKMKGQKGYGWTNMYRRWCTLLKTNTFKKAVGKIQYFDYHGIAYDERNRIKRHTQNNTKYPLVEWGITEKQALEYCYSRGFDWEGLYKIFNRVSCWCCPLQPLSALENLYKYFPELWQELKEMDKKSFRDFRATYTVNELEKRFKEKEKQLSFVQGAK